MNYALVFILLALGLFVATVMLVDLGIRLGRARLRNQGSEGGHGLGVVESAVFALMGLLVAFTFSAAANRFDDRRQLIVQEANAIGTAWLRLDLLPAAAQPELRNLLRQYLDTRLAIYQKLPDLQAAYAELNKANALQGDIWGRAVAAGQQAPSPLVASVFPALNEMFDIATTRTVAAQTHQPNAVFLLLGVLGLICSLLTGYAMADSKKRSWIHILSFSVILSVTIYVIIDLEFPRIGLVRIDAADRVLVELRQSMK